MQRRFVLVLDILAVFLSPFAALALRDGIGADGGDFAKLLPYAAIAAACSIALFGLSNLHRVVWRFFSLPDFIRMTGAAALVVLLPLPICFIINRLDSVARSLPVLQWMSLIVMMLAIRMGARSIDHGRHQRPAGIPAPLAEIAGPSEWTLIVGLSPLSEFYIKAVAQAARSRIRIAGILSASPGATGRIIYRHKVLGAAHELSDVLRTLDIHGIGVTRIVVTEEVSALPQSARSALLLAERERAIQVRSIAELLEIDPAPAGHRMVETLQPPGVSGEDRADIQAQVSAYASLKRALDIAASLFLMVALAPLALLVGLVVVTDVGLPMLFWQQRPGKNGVPFKLYKFRTMHSAHNNSGERIPDSERVTKCGDFLRRLRLDELPQLYNVFIGDMSFIGPRPLLWADMPRDPRVRLSMRPGITGWAQVSGGRSVTAEDKAALDDWYVAHAGWSLDLKILRRTLRLLFRGEELNAKALRTAKSAAANHVSVLSDEYRQSARKSTIRASWTGRDIESPTKKVRSG